MLSVIEQQGLVEQVLAGEIYRAIKTESSIISRQTILLKYLVTFNKLTSHYHNLLLITNPQLLLKW